MLSVLYKIVLYFNKWFATLASTPRTRFALCLARYIPYISTPMAQSVSTYFKTILTHFSISLHWNYSITLLLQQNI
jgi:hypothetical protein